jgi:hypothetical protein
MYRIPWLLAAALALAGCIGGADDGGDPTPALDAGQPVADAAPAADGGAGPVDAAPAVDGGADAMGPPLDVDACEHMIDGPSQAVDPVESAELDGNDVTPGHVRWDCGFRYGASGYPYGFVELLVEEPGQISIYKDPELTMTITDMNGAEQVAASVEPTTCTTTMERHTFDLGAGTYELSYGSFYALARLVVLRADDPGH